MGGGYLVGGLALSVDLVTWIGGGPSAEGQGLGRWGSKVDKSTWVG